MIMDFLDYYLNILQVLSAVESIKASFGNIADRVAPLQSLLAIINVIMMSIVNIAYDFA